MRALRKISLAFVLLVLLAGTRVEAATYKVDADHTAVSFKVKHLFSWVQGKFSKFEGTVEYDPANPQGWSAQGSIDVASIDTGVAKRDDHLRTKDFFDAAAFPQITFKTGKVERVSDQKAKVEGLMTMHGVEKPIVLDVDILGEAKDPWGNVALGLSATTTINRKDFGINWNQALDTGGVLVGEDVVITLDIAALKV